MTGTTSGEEKNKKSSYITHTVPSSQENNTSRRVFLEKPPRPPSKRGSTRPEGAEAEDWRQRPKDSKRRRCKTLSTQGLTARTFLGETEESTRVLGKRARGGQQHLPRRGARRTPHRDPRTGRPVLQPRRHPDPIPPHSGSPPAPRPAPTSAQPMRRGLVGCCFSIGFRSGPTLRARPAAASGGTAAASGRPGAVEAEELGRGRSCSGGVPVGSRGDGARGADVCEHGERRQPTGGGEVGRHPFPFRLPPGLGVKTLVSGLFGGRN